ncbi:DUF4345 family protein [Cellulomonas sp. S1-8]|uniref:DUF4345 family protein n=1 Tax=Cellulomonas sp. S1-8 TaxID=2904790 RepID=UPI002243EE0C|nr:DUF4345 family protein [Cellulomonas sp. S1-8]UZN04617.1 DUF4345 domain-containing protein [Cellulomonas sp. S1-8]
MTAAPSTTRRTNELAETPPPTPARRVLLVVTGAVALLVGAGVALVPAAVHAASGGTAVPDVVAHSDLRGAGVLLAVVGVLLLVAGVRGRHVDAALRLGAAAYLAYAAGRVLGIVLDGHPGTGVLVAGAVELVLGAACAVALRRGRTPA